MSYGQPAGYGSTLYEANPYQPAFGAVSPYGAVPEVHAGEQHPQATLALILGILGTVLGMTCVVGDWWESAASSSAGGFATRSTRNLDAMQAARRLSAVLSQALLECRSSLS